MIYKAAGKQIQILRIENGLKQEDLAEKLDSSQKYISEVENGRKKPSVYFYIKVAQFFHVSLSYLFQDVTKDNNIFIDTAVIKLKQLDEKEQKHIIEYIDLYTRSLDK